MSWYIWNGTDQITATPDIYKTREEAEGLIPALRDRYRAQGWYRDNRWNKINPDDIQYEVRECEYEDDEDENE